MRRAFFLPIVVLGAVGSPAIAAPGLTSDKAFEKLKTLAGEWEVRGDMGIAAPTANYRLTAGGTVVMETLMPGTEFEMVTMYHLDGDALILTHYCSVGNQPRMKMDRKASTSDRLVFSFLDGTNMSTKDGHMHVHALALVDGDHVISTWVMYLGGKEVESKDFSLVRKR